MGWEGAYGCEFVLCIPLHTLNCSINAYAEAVVSVKLANDVTYRR